MFTARSRAFLIATIALSAAACSGGGDGGGATTQPGPAANVGTSSSAFTFVAIGASQAVTATVSDAKGASVTGASVTWTSDDPAVADVQSSGRTATITARKSGSTTIHASSGGASATIGIIVLGVRGISVSDASALIRVAGQQTVTADITADAGVSRSVTWTSGDASIATVSAQGVITGISVGAATITATAVADAGVSASVAVTVLPARGVIVSPQAIGLGAGDTRQLAASVVVEPGASETVTWSTSAAAVATVSQSGLVTAVALGTATISATSTADSSLQGTAAVSVVPVVRSVAIAPPGSPSLFIGASVNLTAAVVADAGAVSTVNWASNNASVATVNAAGLVTAIATGNVSITATSTADTSKMASVSLTVASRPLSISLSPTSLRLTTGGTGSVVATVTADPGVSTAVTWRTSAASVATVSNGTISAIANGSAVITATAVADTSKWATLTVNVGARVAASWSSSGLAGDLIENIVSTYVAGPTSVFTVNSRGDVFLFDGATWTRTASGSTFGTTFTAVRGSSSTNVIAVGTGGKIVIWNGASWQASASGTSADLHDVWVESSTSAFAVGNNGVALRWSGSTWINTATSATSERLNAVWAGGSDTWFAVGTNGTLLRYANGTWVRSNSPTAVNLNDVYGNSKNDVYAVGEVGTVLWFNGGMWSEVPSNGVGSDLYSVTGTTAGGSRIFVGGDRIALQIVNGILDVVPGEPPYSVKFLSTDVDASGMLWVGGERGAMLRWSGTNWTTMNIAPDLIGVYSTGVSNAWAVGEFGFIYRFNGTVWSRQTSPTLSRLNTVWGSSSTDAFAGGDAGLILHWNGSTWTKMSVPVTSDVLGIWGSSSSNVFAVTYDGQVLRWNGAAWTVSTTQGYPLYGVSGSSATDVYAAGDGGTILRFNGTAWSTTNTGSSALFAGVWAAASDNVLAVGVLNSSAASYRYATSWQAFNIGVAAELTSVWGPNASDLYVSGGSGTILRYNGSSWQVMPTGTTEYLWAVTGDPAGLGGGFAVGFNSTLVTGSSSTSVRAARSVTAKGMTRSMEPSREALRTRVTAPPLPQGADRRSLRQSHSARLRSAAKPLSRAISGAGR